MKELINNHSENHKRVAPMNDRDLRLGVVESLKRGYYSKYKNTR